MPAELIGRFCARYPNAETAADHRYNLTLLFSRTGVCHPAQLDEAGVTAYCTHGDRPANNTVYQRLSQVRTFLRWTGKRSKPRRAVAGATLLAVLDRYLRCYPGYRLSSPLICGIPQGSFGPAGPDRLLWGTALHRSCVFRAVQKRAAMAGLGHVAPHDLRRSAAGILHRSADAGGPTTSTCWTSSGCWATPTRRPRCAPTWSPSTTTSWPGPPPCSTRPRSPDTA